jgi:arylsulfatase A-like enzyme
VDTLRPDRLGCYGHPNARTPFWDRLARRGTQFRTALASAPFTVPSHATILTGEYPFRHRVRRNETQRFDPPGATLAEALADRGRRTAAFVASVVLDESTGLDRGFDHYEWRTRPEQLERPADDVVRSALRWVEALTPPDSWFLFVHVYDPHDPYDPPRPWDRAYPGEAYDGEIAFTDHALDDLRRGLEAAGRMEGAMIVAVADHGEAFGEHEETGHGFFVYDTTLRVPLVLTGGAFDGGGARDDVARTIDLFPTIAEAFGFSADSPGRSLQHPDEKETESYGETFYAALTYDRVAELRSLRAGRWKYVHAPREELYDVVADPGETKNLVAEEPVKAAEVRDRLLAMLDDDLARPAGLAGTEEIDPKRVEELRALGYAAGGRRAATDLPRLRDPKDLVGIPDLLDRAEALAEDGRWGDARPLVDRVLVKDPYNPKAIRLLARRHFMRGEAEEGFSVYEHTLERYPEAAKVWRGYASELRRRGRREEAEEALRRAEGLEGGTLP